MSKDFTGMKIFRAREEHKATHRSLRSMNTRTKKSPQRAAEGDLSAAAGDELECQVRPRGKKVQT